MRRSTTETKPKRAERPKEVRREGNDRVTKTEVDVSKVTRKASFYADSKASIGVLSLASEVKLGSVEASKRQGLKSSDRSGIGTREPSRRAQDEREFRLNSA